MKKLFLLGALLCTSNFSSAYGGYYGLSSDDLIAIQVILLIWSVLCLILFFKIWGMTNNVKDIKNNLNAHSSSTSVTNNTSYEDIALRYILNKKLYGHEKASDFLRSAIELEYFKLRDCPSQQRCDFCKNKLNERLGDIIADANITLPDLTDLEIHQCAYMGEFLPGRNVLTKQGVRYFICGLSDTGKIIVRNNWGYKYEFEKSDLTVAP